MISWCGFTIHMRTLYAFSRHEFKLLRTASWGSVLRLGKIRPSIVLVHSLVKHKYNMIATYFKKCNCTRITLTVLGSMTWDWTNALSMCKCKVATLSALAVLCWILVLSAGAIATATQSQSKYNIYKCPQFHTTGFNDNDSALQLGYLIGSGDSNFKFP